MLNNNYSKRSGALLGDLMQRIARAINAIVMRHTMRMSDAQAQAGAAQLDKRSEFTTNDMFINADNHGMTGPFCHIKADVRASFVKRVIVRVLCLRRFNHT